MMQIEYGGASFVTSDEIAAGLLEYAAALANASRAATVRVPAVGLPGQADEVTVLVGPASQLMAEPTESPGREPDGTGFLRRIDDRMNELKRTITYSVDDSSIDWDIS